MTQAELSYLYPDLTEPSKLLFDADEFQPIWWDREKAEKFVETHFAEEKAEHRAPCYEENHRHEKA